MPTLPRTRQDQERFLQERQTFAVGTKVRGNDALHANLSRSKLGLHKRPGRTRDKEMVGTVIGVNDLQLRIIVRWDHPDFEDKPDHPGCVEHLAARYLEVIE